ncbi:transposase [Cohnella fermenti]|uniref:Transposase n=1 Tax=Cohnella fermenti TaxID=2565925 RepID=A0A4S4BLE4_9BACL|nr:transposase [Cohnella fermenti]THF75586.1 transposase [Cohnella fermenti]
MPKSYKDFLRDIGGESACFEYFHQCRWPSAYRCPACGCADRYTISSRRLPLYECVRCRHQASVISGTIPEGTRTSLPFDASEYSALGLTWDKSIAVLSDGEKIDNASGGGCCQRNSELAGAGWRWSEGGWRGAGGEVRSRLDRYR